jgi:LmbE family N-acetylglucosaminyl deacetylase
VIAAHPDDEVLGCGGTIARLAQSGAQVDVLILAEGITSRDAGHRPGSSSAELEALRKAAHAANARLGVRSLRFGGLPDNRMDSIDLLDVVKLVEQFIGSEPVARVLTHHSCDLNVDHRITHQAVVTACRPLPGSVVRSLLFFEVPSSTEWQPPGAAMPFLPAWFEDIEVTWNDKLAALGHYAAEMRPWPHARSLAALEALARWRGATVGLQAAEAFMVGRHIEMGYGA